MCNTVIVSHTGKNERLPEGTVFGVNDSVWRECPRALTTQGMVGRSARMKMSTPAKVVRTVG